MKQFDYVIVGGGSAGCLLANRLSADPGCSVLLIEAGKKEDHPNIQVPAAFSKLFRSRVDWNLHTVPQSHMGVRGMYQPRGRVLGGSSSINAMIYIRGHREDYDEWARQGNEGWSYRDVLPYFKRMERNLALGDDYHGTKGELVVSPPRYTHPVIQAMLMAAQQAGHVHNPDFNGAAQEGVGFYQVNQHRGRRWSSSKAFLPGRVLTRNNLSIWTRSLARQILFDGRQVVGLQVRRGDRLENVEVRKEIILTAGAFGSPQLLMVSGVGDPESLREMGIPVIKALPGVGRNLQDHLICGVAMTSAHRPTMDDADRMPYLLSNLWSFLVQRKGPLCSNVAEFGGFVRTLPGLSAPDLQFHGAAAYFLRHGFDNPRRGGGISLGSTLIKPYSRGEVRLTRPDPEAPLEIDPDYCSDERDMATLVRGYRLVEEVLKQPALAPFIQGRYLPAKKLTRDEDIIEFTKAHAETLYHPVGTCKMGQDAQAVVDEQLRVHGIEGLRVADASVMPEIVRGNTNAPTYMIAEKAADLILQGKPQATTLTAREP